MNVWKLDRWKSLDDSVLSHPGLFLHMLLWVSQTTEARLRGLFRS